MSDFSHLSKLDGYLTSMSVGLGEGMLTWQNHGNRESSLAVAENLSDRLIDVTEA